MNLREEVEKARKEFKTHFPEAKTSGPLSIYRHPDITEDGVSTKRQTSLMDWGVGSFELGQRIVKSDSNNAREVDIQIGVYTHPNTFNHDLPQAKDGYVELTISSLIPPITASLEFDGSGQLISSRSNIRLNFPAPRTVRIPSMTLTLEPVEVIVDRILNKQDAATVTFARRSPRP